MMTLTKGQNVGFTDKHGVWVTARYVEDKIMPHGQTMHIVEMIPSMTSDMTGLAAVPFGKLIRP